MKIQVSKKIRNRGSLTVQFLLGFVLILSMISVFFMMTLTLAVSEIVQYITYSSSRQLFLGNTDPTEQATKATSKYEALTTNKFKFKFTDNALIKITKPGDMIFNNNQHIGLNERDFPTVLPPEGPHLFTGFGQILHLNCFL